VDELLTCGPHTAQNVEKAVPGLRNVAGTLPSDVHLSAMLPTGAARAYDAAIAIAKAHGDARLTPECIRAAITQADCLAAKILQRLGVEPQEVLAALKEAAADL